MSQSIRELLTELAWIEDSIRRVPMSWAPVAPAETAPDATDGDAPHEGLNPDLVTLAEREREIIAELRAAGAAAWPTEPTPA